MNLKQRCQPIELILSDVDGVLTDGGVIFDNRGIEIKQFHIRDGAGIKLWQRAGSRFGLVTGRTSHVVEVRAAELAIELVRQGSEDKLATVLDVLNELSLKPEQVCYIGDDLPDLQVMRRMGLGVAVADACSELQAEAHLVTRLPGGRGAVREVIETVLKEQHRWDELIRVYQS